MIKLKRTFNRNRPVPKSNSKKTDLDQNSKTINQLMNKQKKDENNSATELPSKKTSVERVAILINEKSPGIFELIKKPFGGNEDALQWPCGGIKPGEEPLSGAYKANRKSSHFNQPTELIRVPYKDEYGEKEICIYKGIGVTDAKIDSSYPHFYYNEAQIFESSDVTGMHKFAFTQYLKALPAS